MKNLISYQEEKVSNLPYLEKSSLKKDPRDYGFDLNYARVNNFLQSRVGVIWDDVISEFIHADWVPVRFRTASKIASFVETHTFIENGKIKAFGHGTHGKSDFFVDEFYREVFYVDPVSKTLQLKKKKTTISWRKRRQLEDLKTLRIIDSYNQLHKVKGIWYIFSLPEGCEPDKFFKKNTRWEEDNELRPFEDLKDECGKHYKCYLLYPKFKICQLNKKELKKHNLKNDVPKLPIKCLICGAYDCQNYSHSNTDTEDLTY